MDVHEDTNGNEEAGERSDVHEDVDVDVSASVDVDMMQM